MDAELSPLVKRNFSLISQSTPTSDTNGVGDPEQVEKPEDTILRTEYRATTNRMLRVAVNGFMENLGVVLHVMEELDVDVID